MAGQQLLVRLAMVSLLIACVTGRQTICDARQFRDALTSVCAFHRRDVRLLSHPYSYQTESGKDDVPLAYYPVQQPQRDFFSRKVKRHREFSLHRKCCVTGCTKYDFAGIC